MNRVLISKCPQCGAELIPAFAGMIWSEHRSDHCVRNVWSCEACGYQSEHTVYFCSRSIAASTLVPSTISQAVIIPEASKPRTASVRLRSCSGTSPMASNVSSPRRSKWQTAYGMVRKRRDARS
jgi:hypothetical protein